MSAPLTPPPAMSDLTEKEPRLARVTDATGGRDLLVDPHPLEVTLADGKSLTVSVRVENGVEAPIDLTVTADRDWLEPRRRHLPLLGGETGECVLTVHPTGPDEFSSLCFSWPGATEPQQEYVLVWRKVARPKPPPLPPGVAPPPDWLR